MSKYTLLEVHLDGSPITANAPFSNAADPEDAENADEVESADDADESESAGGGIPVLPLVGVVLLAVLAVAAKKLLSGDVPEDLEVDAEAEIDLD
ncbi:hypothetical protein GJ629_06995 [Halapricum sp. CBA1109]|uniref:hypothetical protein n=1 Tax=Halapricum sp. CBA1109 TaxID=2668068 RepID=UPI0012FA572A|nr:hypothetical protein [Halapricum sp. CBA1109]MUV89672.1 hypothetical protein [Halapricum sp. CBA1109]